MFDYEVVVALNVRESNTCGCRVVRIETHSIFWQCVVKGTKPGTPQPPQPHLIRDVVMLVWSKDGILTKLLLLL